jgi:hypothetical protein
MERKEIEVFSGSVNQAVVRMPGRRFPGSVIQGDSLSMLFGLARKIHADVAGLANEELTGNAAELLNLLDARIRHYERVLAQHNIELPYVRQE